MKNKFVIPIHSFVDVITNSSTELFVIDKEKGLDMVKEIVGVALTKFPPEYVHHLNVEIENPEWYGEGSHEYEVDNAVKYLEMRSFKVEAPKEPQEPEAIIISWERGTMHEGFIKHIEEIFNINVINY